MRIYIAGPYTNPDERIKQANVKRAENIAVALARMGHQFYCAHLHTKDWEHKYPDIPYHFYLNQDLSVLELWAEALYFIASSPGANVELKKASELGLPIFYSLEEVRTYTDSYKLAQLLQKYAFYPETLDVLEPEQQI